MFFLFILVNYSEREKLASLDNRFNRRTTVSRNAMSILENIFTDDDDII